MQKETLKTQDWFVGREGDRATFLRRIGWADSTLEKVGEDCSFRRYFRLRRHNGETVILMEAVPDGSAIATPGHNLLDFVRLSAYLRALGLSAPAVYEVDEASGYLLLEDFGDLPFRQALTNGVDQGQLYALATDVLRYMGRHACESDIDLPDYYASHIHEGRRRVVDWTVPLMRRARNPDGLVEDYLSVWDGIEAGLPSVPKGFLHIDYHVENLMWIPERQDMHRCGILDFQGAMVGPLPYDLANLLEDARVDVPLDLRVEMLARFCEGMNAEEKEVFENWYRVLATQFHCRVMGQFIRLAVKDNKTGYLQYLPRLSSYLEAGLQHPVLSPLKAWFSENAIAFDGFHVTNLNNEVQAFIRSDAF